VVVINSHCLNGGPNRSPVETVFYFHEEMLGLYKQILTPNHMNNKPIIYGVITVVVIGAVIALVSANRSSAPEVASNTEQQPTEQEQPLTNNSVMEVKFNNAKKSAHYETNTPAHGSVLAAPPVNVVIDFNFDLAVPSAISIMKEGKEYGQGDTVIDTNKLSMRRNFAADAPDGKYMVTYKACWPDRSCHDGSFEFAVDRSRASSYKNMQNLKEVTIRMSEIMFAPKNIIISLGTKVTWVNDEDVEHYVNTDSHPAHTYYPIQNSRSLAKGATYSVIFDKLGAYPYHCSAHADRMTGNIIVKTND
jgi:plastocyanin